MLKFIRNFLLKPKIRYKLIFPGVFSAHPDEEVLEKAMRFVSHNKVDGDYLEFGVWKGRSFVRAYNIWKHLFFGKGELKPMKFYAFDSFEGLPEIRAQEDQSGEFTKGQYFYSEEDFRKSVEGAGVDLNRVRIVKGWFDEILNDETKKKLPLKRAAIIFIDCDLYESTVPVLDFITDYVTDGTVLIFDDWFCFRGSPERGEQKAFLEWLKKNPQFKAVEYHKFNWRGNSFIINRK